MALSVIETIVALAIVFALLGAVMHLARLSHDEQRRQFNRRPGWLERSPNGSALAPWRESAYDRDRKRL